MQLLSEKMPENKKLAWTAETLMLSAFTTTSHELDLSKYINNFIDSITKSIKLPNLDEKNEIIIDCSEGAESI